MIRALRELPSKTRRDFLMSGLAASLAGSAMFKSFEAVATGATEITPFLTEPPKARSTTYASA